MPWFDFFWTDAIIEHLAEHDVTPEEFEYVVCNPATSEQSDSSGRPLVKGYTQAGRRIVCIYELEDDGITVVPVTAYEPQEEEKPMPDRRLREFTPELRERWLRAVEEEERARPANSRRALRTFAAIEEQTFSGELRRAIIASGIHVQEVAERAQVPFDTLNAFMGGDTPLDSEAINRIVQTLGGHLVAGV